MNKGLVGGALVLGAVLAAVTRRESEVKLPVDSTDDVVFRIERLLPVGWGYKPNWDTKKNEEFYFDAPRWSPIPSLYCFGRDGSGGSCRLPNAVWNEVERLCGGAGFSFIANREDGLKAIALMEKHIGEKLRLVRVITKVEAID